MRLRLQVTDDAASLNRDHNGLEVYQTVPSLSMSFKDYNDFKTKADVDAVDAELSKIDSKVIPYRRNRMGFFHSDLWHRTDGTAFKPGFKVSPPHAIILRLSVNARPAERCWVVFRISGST